MRSALVTGASSGIGLATALLLARRGYRVFAAMRRPVADARELNEAVAREALAVRALTLDVHDEASVTAGVATALHEAGHLDVLVNNAGIGGRGTIEEAPVEWAKGIFETNYFGAVRVLRAVLPSMRERRGGTIVTISSVMGRVAPGGHGHYCASKHAIEAVSEALAQEMRPFGVRVAIVEPGVVLTPIFSGSRRTLDPGSPYFETSARLERFFRKGLERPTQPDTVAAAVLAAIETPEPRLRYVVGADAEGLIGGRRRISDEAWVDEGRPMPEAEYVAMMRARYGLELG